MERLENIEIFDANQIIKTPNKVYGHTSKFYHPETLKEHLDRTYKYMLKLVKAKKLDKVLDNILENIKISGRRLGSEHKRLIKTLFVNAIYLHDIGKVNPAYQYHVLGNMSFKPDTERAENNNTDHSLFSAVIYLSIYSDSTVIKTSNKEIRLFLNYLLFSFANLIGKHHSHLQDDIFDTDKVGKSLKDKIHESVLTLRENPYYLTSVKNVDLGKISNGVLNSSLNIYRSKIEFDAPTFYILNKLLYSLIAGCDYYATYEYINNEEIESFGEIEKIGPVMDVFNNDKIVKGIEEYKSTGIAYKNMPINKLRSEMFIESEKRLMDELDKNIFYLEAPTGSGKTITSLNLALKAISRSTSINKIFYIFPYNTLSDQTNEVIRNTFGDSLDSAVINSITPIKRIEESDRVNYKKSLLDRLFLHYPLIMTSHVNFYSYLFGTSKESSFPLSHLCNSVIIVDEIQAHNNSIWKEIILFFHRYSKLLNLKIIIMSATLPKLDRLLAGHKTQDFVSLIKDKDYYFNNEVFRGRVKPNFELLDKGAISHLVLANKINESMKDDKYRKILVGMISKKEAKELYEILKSKYFKNPDIEVYEMTGDDNKAVKRKIIERTKTIEKGKKMILVATQVIEAGVDIDMDIGFKAISILDSEEQFMGRINRSCMRKDSVVYFFYTSLDSAKRIYGKDMRFSRNLISEKYREVLIEKSFTSFYESVMADIEFNKKKNSPENISNFLEDVKLLRFDTVKEKMKLIEDITFRVFLPHLITLEDGTKLNGKRIWQEYENLVSDREMGYAKRIIKLSRLREYLDYFVYNVYKEPNPAICKEVNGIYYIEDGDRYITGEEKFDRIKYNEEVTSKT